MAMDPKDVAAAIDGPPTVHRRNINIDTHVGQAPNRPYALLEDHMASVTNGYRTVQDLKRALRGQPKPDGLPAGAPDPNDVVEKDGALVRYVVSSEPRERVVVAGVIKERLRFMKRNVALTMEGARAASQEGVPTDYWNGFTWLRDGFKPERDFPTMAKANALSADEPLVFDADVSATDAAVLRHEVARMDAAHGPLPVERGKER